MHAYNDPCDGAFEWVCPVIWRRRHPYSVSEWVTAAITTATVFARA